jgi:hypothetical protein
MDIGILFSRIQGGGFFALLGHPEGLHEIPQGLHLGSNPGRKFVGSQIALGVEVLILGEFLPFGRRQGILFE